MQQIQKSVVECFGHAREWGGSYTKHRKKEEYDKTGHEKSCVGEWDIPWAKYYLTDGEGTREERWKNWEGMK